MTVTPRAPLEVGVAVRDLERAARFYEEVLGFRRISEATLAPDRAELAGFGRVAFRMVRMQTEYGERVKLLETDPRPEDPGRPTSMLGRSGFAYLTFVVTDIEAALARLKAAGAEMITAEPVQTRPGTRLAFFRDSEGNPLELVQYDDLKAYRPDIFAGD
jgi:catechol 2,3-dioxygenase-like lactoylglutathione lyase family enzyme